MGLRSKSANWDNLEPFTVRIIGTSQLGKRFRIGTAPIIGPNAGHWRLRRKTFRIADIFVEPIGSIVAQLNAVRAEALGIPDSAPVAAVEPEEAAVGLADFKLPWLTLALLAVLVAVFALEIRFAVQSGSSLSLSPASLFVLGGLSRAAVLSGGEWYRLFTAPLLHANLAHIVGNGVALLWGGWLLERLVGRLWFFSLFAVGALGGSLLSLAVMPAKMISVGASGALMGLFAALFVGSFRLASGSDGRLRLQVNSLRILIPSLLPLFSTSVGHIDYGAHFGGALSGAATAALLLKHWPQTARVPQLRRVAAGIAVGGGILFAASAGIAATKYSKYDFTLVPRAELPKSAADRQVLAASLVARYPGDPHSRAAVASLSFCCGRGTCQTQNEKAQREACEIGVVQHDAEGRRGERQRHQYDRRPEQIERGGGQRPPAEDVVIEQHDGQAEGVAQPGPQAALAGERHGVVLQRHVTQIERLAERQKADDQKPIGLAGCGQEQWAFHCGSFPDGVGAIHNHRR